MVRFCPSGDVKMVWFCPSGDVGIVWWNPSGDVKDGLILGSLGRRWFGLVFALGRRKIHLTSPESGQRLPSQTIRLPREKITRETSKTGSGYIWHTFPLHIMYIARMQISCVSPSSRDLPSTLPQFC